MDEITKAGAMARAQALEGFSLNATYHIAQGDMAALGHALEGLERTLRELRAYHRRETPAPVWSDHVEGPMQ